MEIKIKTGVNLTRLLQSTVTIPQAYTELVKNSIQNAATKCTIKLDKNCTTILDNGLGFDHEQDASGKNGFDKYFVYGNSYESSASDSSTSLGQMGIGGKLSNDRLTDPDHPWWSIETKNKHGKCFIMTYKPTDLYEYLDDYSPTVEEIDPRDCVITTDTGTKITIHNLDPEITYSGWPHDEIKKELASFFGLLVYDLQKLGKEFELILDEEPINFAYELPGIPIPAFTTNFNYEVDEVVKSAPVRFQMALMDDIYESADHPLKGLNIISYVKVCDYVLSDREEINTQIKIVKERTVDQTIKDSDINADTIISYASKLIGFISCRELSTVLDRNNMPAKDLSHHMLRLDHPCTKPFLRHVVYTLVKWIMEYHASKNATMTSAIDALSKEISSLVAEQFEADELDLDIFVTDEGYIEELAEESDEGTVEGEEAERLRESVQAVIDHENVQESMAELTSNLYDIPQNDWGTKLVRKLKKAKYIPYLLTDLGPEEKLTISKMDPFHKFRVLINTTNPKYLFFNERNSPDLMSMYISEILIKEVLYKKEGKYIKTDVDKKVSEFYKNYLDQVKLRILKTVS